MSDQEQTPRQAVRADLAEVVLRAARELTVREHAEAVRLTPAVSNVMRYIDEHPGAVPSEIAEAVGLLRSNLSAALRELEKVGFVERRSDPRDRRSVHLFPTEAAARNLAVMRADWAAWVDEALGEVDTEQEKMVIEVVERLAAGLVRSRRKDGVLS